MFEMFELFEAFGPVEALETISSGATMTELASPVSIGHMIGRDQYDATGWIDEVRIIKGAAPWTSNFTPPEAPYCD